MTVSSLRPARTIALAATAAALIAPAAAFADKPADKGACEGKSFTPPGLDGRESMPPGIAKKHAKGGAPCDKPSKPDKPGKDGKDGPDGDNGKGNDGKNGADAQPTVVTVVVQQPAPAATSIASTTKKPVACVKGRRFKVKLTKWGAVRRARVLLNGRVLKTKIAKKGRRAHVVVDLRNRKAGTYVLRQSVVTRSGKLRTGTRRYRVCG